MPDAAARAGPQPPPAEPAARKLVRLSCPAEERERGVRFTADDVRVAVEAELEHCWPGGTPAPCERDAYTRLNASGGRQKSRRAVGARMCSSDGWCWGVSDEADSRAP